MTKHRFKQPRQRLSFASKGKKWRTENVDAGDSLSFYHNAGVRKDLRNKLVNMNLYNGKVDVRDMAEVLNPNKLQASYVPDNIPHHPILVPKIDLLVGEESNRRFDWKVMVTNSDAVSTKEDAKKEYLMQKVKEFLEANYEEEQLKVKLQELGEYMKYDWQDLRERMASQILKHYYREQDFGSKFNEGFKDALLYAEEIYQCDIVHNEPIMQKLNPFKVRAVRSGNSDRLEDASIIIVEDHKSPNQIVDLFHDELKIKDIDNILDYSTYSGNGEYTVDDENHVLLRDGLEGDDALMDSLFHMAEINGHTFNHNYTDEEGNIRVLTVYWKSLKKIKKVKYYDEFGETQYKIRSEEYVPDESMGEEVTNLWVNEMWEGTKIGKDIYVKMKPRQVQYNKIHNPSLCHAGIIGQIYNTNQAKAVSLVDRMKNYQYMYDAMWDRLNKSISTNYGKILELDIAKIPDNWEIDKWMHFAVANKIAVVDSFKEGNHGASTGKLAGAMNTQGGRSIDMETGNYIQQHIQLLEFIKFEMGEISGVNQQRQGQVDNRETVGGVERAVSQSSHITEWWFSKHEKLKLRVMETFLETAKVALKGNNKKVQYILDDLSVEMLNLEGDVFAEADYGLAVTNSNKSMELEQMLKQNAQAFMQNGGSMATLMDVFFSDSIIDMRRKIENAEEKMHQRQSEQAQAQNKLAEQTAEREHQLKVRDQEIEEANNIRDNEAKLAIKQMELANQGIDDDNDNDGIDDLNENAKLSLDRDEMRQQRLLKIKELNDKMQMHKDKMKREDKKIAASKAKASTQKSNG